MGTLLRHEPCPACGSRDNLARYADGGAHCYSVGCGYRESASGREAEAARPSGDVLRKDWSPLQGEYRDLPQRGLDEADCRHWGYQIGKHPTLGFVHIMNSRDASGRLVAQKYRSEGKKFHWASDTKEHPLYGAWLWPSRGKNIVITEGELDAISVSKSFGHKWPVVSLPDGTGSVRKALSSSYSWLDGFDRICLWFDNDKPGQDAAEEAAELLPPGKVWIIRSPEGSKDANDTLREHGADIVVRCYYNATQYRPDGIVDGSSFTRESVKKAMDVGYPFPWPDLQDRTYGLRQRELTLLTAGSGIGKSTLAREIAYHLRVNHGCKIGNIYLEEQNTTTVQAYVAIDNNVPLAKLRRDPSIISDSAWDSSLAKVMDGMWFYDHFGSMATDTLVSKITYMARVCGVEFVILDHISIVTSGLESSSEGERKDIDILLTKLQQCIQQTGVGIIAVVHLKRKPGLSYNEGGHISLGDLRGSGALEQLSHNVYALERDQQADDEEKACQETIRVLKCRETGHTGISDTLKYDRTTGRLVLHQTKFNEEEEF